MIKVHFFKKMLPRSAVLAPVLALLFASLLTHRDAAAQEEEGLVEIFDVVQQDRNADGRPDLTVIECSFATAGDRVLVFDRDDDMSPSETWQGATDFDGDLWVFDALADGRPELAISFERTAAGLVAELWDDQDGRGGVRYQAGDAARVTESEWPTVRVVAPGGWWTDGDRVNFNLKIEVDGAVRAAGASQSYLRYLEVDGAADFLIEVYDWDEDGRPDVHWADAWPAAPADWGIRRTSLMVNPSDDEPPIQDSLFWPYLGTATVVDEAQEAARDDLFSVDEITKRPRHQGFVKDYNRSHPPIQIAWHKGIVAYVGEFVASRFNDDTWFIYSINRLEASEAGSANFEAPFAFYDLAGDDDGVPEQQIRLVQALPGDLWLRRELGIADWNAIQLQELRYSWDQDDDGFWDYKFGLVGRNDITQYRFQVADLAIQTVPPGSLRDWVAQTSWDGATFVVAESAEPRSSEGLKEWEIDGRWRLGYVTGILDEPPREAYQEIGEGFRGEVSFDHRAPVSLYLSPVDHKLHLLGAERGLWNVDNERRLAYDNLDSDPYVDRWTLSENGEQLQTLYAGENFLLLVGADAVEFVETDVPLAPLESDIRPPSSHEAWLDLDTLLADARPSFSPTDLGAMLGQFAGTRTRVEEVTVDDVRLTQEGVRFALNVAPETELPSEMLPAGVNLPAAPGRYLASFDGDLSLEPMTPPEIVVLDHEVAFDGAQPSPLVPLEVRAVVANRGLEDVANLEVKLFAENGAERQEIAEFHTHLWAGTNQPIQATWTPPRSGDWTVTLEAEELDVAGTAARDPARSTHSLQLAVAPSLSPGWQDVILETGGHPARVIVLPLVAIFLLGGILTTVLLRWEEA